LTTLSNGQSTSSISYDENGNVSQKTTDGIATTYIYDYANRLIALGVNNATTSYTYDYMGNRVTQVGTSSTYIYPSKWFSVASSTGSGVKYSTTTEYIFGNDALVATVDQQIAFGAATGSPQTSYIHPDHLGSTNVITNASGSAISTKDYYPFGSVRVNSGSASLARGYIGEFTDQSNLSYLNARYYEGSRGQFLSQDPAFWEVGNGDRGFSMLADPQLLNSYSYAGNNPITMSDADGEMPTVVAGAIAGGIIGLGSQFAADLYSGQRSSWQAYAGATAGGAVQGALFGSGAGVAALIYGGALSGVAQGGVREGLNYTSGNGFDYGSVLGDIGISAFSNLAGGVLMKTVGVPSIAGITSGRNSFDAITQSIFTKLQNGTINNVSLNTNAKMGASFSIANSYSTAFQTFIQARQQAAQSYNCYRRFYWRQGKYA
jgi:RHS repeat-associated protein